MTPADFKAARKALGLSARGMAAALSGAAPNPLAPRTIRRWEAGDSPIPATVTVLIPRLLTELREEPAPVLRRH